MIPSIDGTKITIERIRTIATCDNTVIFTNHIVTVGNNNGVMIVNIFDFIVHAINCIVDGVKFEYGTEFTIGLIRNGNGKHNNKNE